MIKKILGLIIGTVYLVFFWVGGPFSLYVLFFKSSNEIRNWFLIMAVGAIIVTVLALWHRQYAQPKTAPNAPGAPGFSLLPMGLISTGLNLLIAITAALWS
jgi:hypothetical protein